MLNGMHDFEKESLYFYIYIPLRMHGVVFWSAMQNVLRWVNIRTPVGVFITPVGRIRLSPVIVVLLYVSSDAVKRGIGYVS